MNPYRAQLAGAAGAVTIEAATAFAWFGERSPALPARVVAALPESGRRDALRYQLQARLYEDFYLAGEARPRRSGGATAAPRGGPTPFLERLSAANAGRGPWEDGWRLQDVADGLHVVHRGDLRLWVGPHDCRAPDGEALRPGGAVLVHLPRERLGLSPGFYLASSDAPFGPGDGEALVRLYWHLSPEGAARLVARATALLNGAGIPFSLKVLRDPGAYDRRDAGVLYLAAGHVAAAAPLVAEVYRDVARRLRPGTPALTQEIAPGLGLAEDPGRGESFGQHRCRLLAEGLIAAHEAGARRSEERLANVLAEFEREGIDPDRPYLNPDSGGEAFDELAAALRSTPATVVAPRPDAAHPAESPAGEPWLAVAARIADRLAQSALRHDGRCTWIGALGPADAVDPGAAPAAMRHGTLGPDLYGGTAGVALFLGELHAVTGDPDARRLALGAIRQSLAHLDSVPSPVRRGLYSGWAGIALVAARLGRLLGEAELVERAHGVAERLVAPADDAPEYDLIAGSAGAIVALVILRDLLDDASLLDHAAALGDGLLEAADRHGAAWSWRSHGSPFGRSLTGLGHGAAGIGLALLELGAATGEARYTAAALAAFAYERRWFDRAAGNWRDLRALPRRTRPDALAAVYAAAWCHGASGIGLARLRAWQLTGVAACRDEALTALGTTDAALRAALERDDAAGNYSLCHGLAGNADILLDGADALGEQCAGYRETALAVARDGARRYGADPAGWPGGLPGGATPGLMLGLAGTGYFYLRLARPEVPSVLLPTPEQYTR